MTSQGLIFHIKLLCCLLISCSISMDTFANDKLAITYASFNAADYDNYKSDIETFRSIGFQRISLVPTYYHENIHEIILTATPPAAMIGNCLDYLIANDIDIIYKPHIDPVKYLYTYDVFESDNSSWRVNVPWRGFFDMDPVIAGYYENIVKPVLASLAEIYKKIPNSASTVRIEIGTEMMNSIIRYGDKWIEVVQEARNFIDQQKLGNYITVSHNFSHHIQIEQDYILRLRENEKRWLKDFLQQLDEISVSQYMDLTIFMEPAQSTIYAKAEAVAKAVLHYHKTFREDILKGHLALNNWDTIKLNIGEFGIGVGGLKHPNYWEGSKTVDPVEQEIGILGFLKALDQFSILENEKDLDATIWTVGDKYDIFGLQYQGAKNENAISHITGYLKDEFR